MVKIPPNIACPLCKGKIYFDPDKKELICYFDRLAYPVIDSIPMMLPAKARRLDIDEKRK